ncbi:hypothetical protein M758_5G133000 [Ceratodon purpureus]|nr:hypothetical protein M758_5G133000 [Ceratodon purpureus]
MKRRLLTMLIIITVIFLWELKGARGVQAVAPLQLTIACGPACDYRCSKASRAKLCLRDCNVCCQRCQCVPPGTAGNKEVCPCYASMRSSKGTPKCP